MASPGATTTTATAIANPANGAESEEWEDGRLEAALEELKEMHIQVRRLRTTIPDMIRPLTAPPTSPENLFQDFLKSTNTGVGKVKSFIEYMQNDKRKTILQKAATSRKEAPDGIHPWMVNEHPDWLEWGDAAGDKMLGLEVVETVDEFGDAGPAEIETWEADKAVVEEFRKDHKGMRMDTDDEKKTIAVRWHQACQPIL
ncbi:MAG: hypothetical protein M1838_005063 [Thelocarpon superellum]|nr:MAG: hypothetical protein M1838_005063 [Thelocarpon superellum]